MTTIHRTFVALVAMFVLPAISAGSPITLLSNNGYSFPGVTPNKGLFNPNQLKAMEFTLSQSATDVTIAVAIGASSTPAGTVNAYLVQVLGSTTAPIAQTTISPSFAIDGSLIAPTPLFYGLSLPAGQYYVLLYDTSLTDYWQLASTQTLGGGTTTDGYLYKGATPASPVWSSTLTGFSLAADPTIGVGYAFTVTGSPGAIPPAPTTYPAPPQSCVNNTVVESELYALRQQVGTNDAAVTPGDVIQAGAYCVYDSSLGVCSSVGANADVTGSVTLPIAPYSAPVAYPLVSANDATNPNHLLHSIPVQNGFAPAGPAQITATIGGSSMTCDTPPLTDANGVLSPSVAYAQNMTFSTTSGVLTPTIGFAEPAAFLGAAANASGGGALRLQIWDLQPAAPVLIYAANSGFSPAFSPSTSNYSFDIPASWTNNGGTYSLQLNHPYAIEIQSMLMRSNAAGFGNGNANVFARSRVFADYTPVSLPSGVSTVSLPASNPTGSSSGTPQYTYTTTVVANTPVYVETPAPTSQTVTFTSGVTDPNFYSVQAPVGGAYDGASIYVPSGSGGFTLVGVLQNGSPLFFGAGVRSFEIVLPGGVPAAMAKRGVTRRDGMSPAGSNGSGPALLGLAFTASGSFTGAATPGPTQQGAGDQSSSDGPLPLWALGALGAGLVGIASRRLKKIQTKH